jgi:hypothetical protein
MTKKPIDEAIPHEKSNNILTAELNDLDETEYH